MLTSILAAIAALTRFLPALEKWGDVLYAEWKAAQARAITQHNADAQERFNRNEAEIEYRIADAAAAEKARVASERADNPPGPTP